MKFVVVLLSSLLGSLATAQSFPVLEATCTNGRSRPAQPVPLRLGGHEGNIAQILKIDEQRSLVFSIVPVPNHGEPDTAVYTFKLVVNGQTTIATSETYGVVEQRRGQLPSLNFLLVDDAKGLYLKCEVVPKI